MRVRDSYAGLAMDEPVDDPEPDHESEPGDDVREQQVGGHLRQLFESNPTTVYYGRQLEVMFERDYFHWVTNRALRSLEGFVTLERHSLEHASPTTLAWNRRYRYPRGATSARGVQHHGDRTSRSTGE
jgi:hypothetical protein